MTQRSSGFAVGEFAPLPAGTTAVGARVLNFVNATRQH